MTDYDFYAAVGRSLQNLPDPPQTYNTDYTEGSVEDKKISGLVKKDLVDFINGHNDKVTYVIREINNTKKLTDENINGWINKAVEEGPNGIIHGALQPDYDTIAVCTMWLLSEHNLIFSYGIYDDFKVKIDEVKRDMKESKAWGDIRDHIYLFCEDIPNEKTSHYSYIRPLKGEGDDTKGGSSSDDGRMRLLAMSAVGLLACLTGALAPVVYS